MYEIIRIDRLGNWSEVRVAHDLPTRDEAAKRYESFASVRVQTISRYSTIPRYGYRTQEQAA